jgi:GNAT superfamily N-acetyltransferase
MLRIEPWQGQLGVAETLAAWHVREWSDIFPDWTEQIAREEFHTQLQDTNLPATWLAFDGDTLLGSASALLQDASEFLDISGPWLASVFVQPEYRGNAVAQKLIEHAMCEVRKLGYTHWTLFTENHHGYYQKLGWEILCARPLHGKIVTILEQKLG